jgi:hypothetical protein
MHGWEPLYWVNLDKWQALVNIINSEFCSNELIMMSSAPGNILHKVLKRGSFLLRRQLLNYINQEMIYDREYTNLCQKMELNSWKMLHYYIHISKEINPMFCTSLLSCLETSMRTRYD